MEAIQFLTPAEMIANGLHLPPLDTPPVAVPPGTCCSLTGQPITVGYPVSSMVTDATSEFLDHFRGGIHGYVSDSAARLYKTSDPRKGNPTARSFLAFDDWTCHMPMIARASAAEQGRPCWSELVRQVWVERAGRVCLCILTTDTKKRLWPRARVGSLGARTPVYLYDSGLAVNAVYLLNWARMIDVLTLVETVYDAGFPKTAVRRSLYECYNVAQTAGMLNVRGWELALRECRNTPEFLMALLIAQKHEEENGDERESVQLSF